MNYHRFKKDSTLFVPMLIRFKFYWIILSVSKKKIFALHKMKLNKACNSTWNNLKNPDVCPYNMN